MGAEADAVVRVRGLAKSYARRGRVWAPGPQVAALAGIDLDLPRAAVLGLAGASGAGKSTLARCLAGLERPSAGEIWFHGVDLVRAGGDRRIQLVFQDPASAMNPRFAAWEVVAEPWAIRREGTPRERRRRAAALLEQVGIAGGAAERPCLGVSGGQRQRLALARALAVEPEVLILDESLTGLDLSLQEQMLKLVRELQAVRGFAWVLVSHDLALLRAVADGIAVLASGRIVEHAAPEALWTAPAHPASRALVEAARALAP
jgi:ABC-type glutathione transport system ATPase component